MSPTHVITVMAAAAKMPDLGSLDALLDGLAVKRLAGRSVPVPTSLAGTRQVEAHAIVTENPESLQRELTVFAEQTGVDVVCQSVAERYRRYRLAVFDMDSTLIRCEVIDQLAAAAGVGAQVAEITERAMRGELDFDASFRARLALLEGLEESHIATLADQLPAQQGLSELTTTLRAQGVHLVILSGGFMPFAQRLQADYGFDHVIANVLDVSAGRLTGKVVEPIVNSRAKAEALRDLAQRMNIDLASCIAMGDGANDLEMIQLAGLGVAFHAKPKVRAAAPHRINSVGLDGLCYLMGRAGEFASD